MKLFIINLVLVALAFAAPVRKQEKRQLIEKEFSNGPCREIILFFVRGTIEPENMGIFVGPFLSDGLKSAFGASRVAVEGIEYAAGIVTNFLPDGADPVGVANMKELFYKASTKCPNSIVVASGYSQGAAITHEAIDGLSSSVKNQIAGVVTFGDTRNLQAHGQISGYPTDDLLIICNPGDLVCIGTLVITPAHVLYQPRVPEAVAFLSDKIGAVK